MSWRDHLPVHQAEIGIEAKLQQYATQLRSLGKRMLGDVVEIGRILHEAKVLCGHGNFLPWLDHEFGWTDRTARNFMRVYELSKTSENFSDLDLPVSAVYLLAAPSTPDKVRQEVIAKAKAGEAVTVKDVKRAIDDYSMDDPPPWPASTTVIEEAGLQISALDDADELAAMEYRDRLGSPHKPKPAQSAELVAALARAERAEKRADDAEALDKQHYRELKARYADVIALTKEKKALLEENQKLRDRVADLEAQIGFENPPPQPLSTQSQ